MKKKLPVLFLGLLLTFCKEGVKEKDKVFYIIKEGENFIESESFKNNPPPPINIVYGKYNFILPDQEKVYLHTVSYFNKCWFGMKKEDSNKMPFLGLKPEDIKEIKMEDLSSLLGTTIREESLINPKLVITISSSSDTIRNPAFEQLSKCLIKDGHRYNIRKITAEESFAINTKNKGSVYNPIEAFNELGLDSSGVRKK